MTTFREACPPLGVGVGLRRDHLQDLPRTERELDWVEFVPESFVGLGGRIRRSLLECAERWPLVAHGTALDIGGPTPLNQEHLAGVASLLQQTGARFYSDHLCYSTLGGRYTHELLPLPFREDVVELLAPRIREVQERVERPFLLENPSYYARMPGCTLDEASFIRAVLEEGGCGLLLDVNNVYVNSQNLGYDARAFFDALPLERVGQIHLAGHHREGEVIIDSHSTAVPDPVWELYRYVLERTGPVSTLIEWDLGIPPLDVVLDEADKARAILAELNSPRQGSQPGGEVPA